LDGNHAPCSDVLIPDAGLSGAVQKVLENIKPTVELAQQKYLEAHNAIAVSHSFHVHSLLS
jgi:hypothetical protein